jgi:ADP-ribosylglycohydrolase
VRDQQFSGSLVGQCLGDALGFVVEGCSPAVCRKYVSETLNAGHAAGEGSHASLAFGQYSDDSQLARELMQSFAARGRFDPEDYARRIAAIFSEGRILGRGRSTQEAAERLARGVPWDEAGTSPPSAGNGSAMRAGPIGLFFFDDPEGMVRAAHDQGRITHRDPRCSAGAVAIAGAVALTLRGEHIDASRFLTRLTGWAGQMDESVAYGIERWAEWVDLPAKEAAPLISSVGRTPDYVDRWPGISPFVTSSVLWSLYAFLKNPDDYWETIRTAIAVGGDVDTTAAMAGAISGAHLGLEAVPLNLTHRLTDQGTWGQADLIDLADQCYETKFGSSGL